MHPVKEITTVAPYIAVILGNAIRAGSWLPEAVEFVKRLKSDLEKLQLVVNGLGKLSPDSWIESSYA